MFKLEDTILSLSISTSVISLEVSFIFSLMSRTVSSRSIVFSSYSFFKSKFNLFIIFSTASLSFNKSSYSILKGSTSGFSTPSNFCPHVGQVSEIDSISLICFDRRNNLLLRSFKLFFCISIFGSYFSFILVEHSNNFCWFCSFISSKEFFKSFSSLILFFKLFNLI